MKKIIVTILLVVLLGTSVVQALPNWDIYSDAVIEEGDQYNNVRIFDTPPDNTTVDMTGGLVDSLTTYDQSTFNISGGYVSTLWGYNSSTINAFGGEVFSLYALDTSVIDVFDDAIVDVLVANGTGLINMSGGIVDHAGVNESGTLNLSGGLVSDRLWASGSGIINFYGYNLAKTNTGGHYGFGFVSGEWVDRTTFNINLSGPDTYSHINLINVIAAGIDIVPNTFNLTSKGKWITCYIRLDEGYDVGEIDPDTILLERRIKPAWSWFNEQQQVAMVKFKRSKVQEILEPGECELVVTGHLADLTYFEGTDTIRVIDKGHKEK